MTWETGICKKKKAGGTFSARKLQIVDGVIVHYCQDTILQYINIAIHNKQKVRGLFPTHAHYLKRQIPWEGFCDKVL